MEQFIKKYKDENPEKYKRAQEYGDFIMSTRFANVDTFKVEETDKEGDEILYIDITNKIKLYGFGQEDLETYEIDILKKKLGDQWEEKMKELLEPLSDDLKSLQRS